MDTNECSLCRPGGFALTRQMFQFAGIEIPEAGAAETEATDPAVPLRVIDIGCGTGGTMRWLSEHFPDWQISGLDKNPDVHEPGWIETGCAEKLPYPDQTADIILMECSCSKAAEPAAALREVYRVLKPEGWLLIYHGVLASCNGFVYSFGSALLDLDQPWKVKFRSGPYLLSPQTIYECTGDVPNVTFPCAALHDEETGRIAIYYGCADTVTGLAFGYIPEIIEFTKKTSII